jgi:hypothetical protein
LGDADSIFGVKACKIEQLACIATGERVEESKRPGRSASEATKY